LIVDDDDDCFSSIDTEKKIPTASQKLRPIKTALFDDNEDDSVSAFQSKKKKPTVIENPRPIKKGKFEDNDDNSSISFIETKISKAIVTNKRRIIKRSSCVDDDPSWSGNNLALEKAFKELSILSFKNNYKGHGIGYQKVATAISKLTFVVTADNAIGLGKGQNKAHMIGESTAKMMYEFLTTGTIQELEKKRIQSVPTFF
jgi:hypothetical protein